MDEPDDAAKLRAAAESRLTSPYHTSDQAPANLPRLLHELQVHQIELKMQNEELRLTQAALEKIRDRYMDLYDFAPVGYLTIDHDGKIVDANLKAATILGTERTKLLLKRLAHFIDDADQDSWHHLMQSIQQHESESEQTADLIFKRNDGIKLNVQLNFLRMNVQSEPLVLRISFTDITERKQAEIEMRIAATAFESHEGMLITDAYKVILRVNQAFTDITGYSAAEVIGKTPHILSSGRQDVQFYQKMWKHICEFGSWEGEVWSKRKNGEIYPEMLTITAVKNQEGVVTNYVGVLSDNTLRMMQLEKLRSIAAELEIANGKIEEERAHLAEKVTERTAQLEFSNHAKDAFLATMSHEIRTPLGGMLGMMELLELSKLSPEQRDRLAVAQSSGKNLLRIVNDILDWSKIEAGKLELSPQQASITEMLNSVASTYAQLAADKGIALSINIDPHLSREHIFDPLRLTQILNNFTSNAVKFTQQGSVEFSAYRLETRQGQETIRFSVKDSGGGINEEQQSRLFQHYEQATADTARMYGGTGLGLAICRRLAELMDGTLSVESTTGVGSTFYFTISLPVANVTSPMEAPASSPQTETPAQQASGAEVPLTVDGRPLAVLIVDDHPVNRMLLKQQLGILGVQVVAAESGSPALKLWQNSHFDIIITDCHMPEMDGYELTRKIREIEQPAGGSFRIPIIAWTANVLSDEVERCQVAGMDDLLTKPTELAELRAMIVKWLNGK